MIIGTAGHIDHGKTSLVRALTGVDTDRLKEEKARGISIDLGFAYLPASDGSVLGFVDVPGHERFVHTMVAGASGIDFVVLAIAADDGVMPQTLEHLAIIDLLGVRQGVVALTKADLASVARRWEVASEIADVLAPTALAGAPVMAVSTVSHEGIAELKRHLFEAARAFGHRAARGLFRMAVDRSFNLAGIGTVVTGTVLSGEACVGDRVLVSPSGLPARIRSIHAQNRSCTRGQAGERCALNLAGEDVAKDAIRRGDVALAPDLHAPADRIDVLLRMLPSETRPATQWMPVRLHHAAAEVGARIVLLADEPLVPAPGPGGEKPVQLVLDRPIAAAVGDRFVLRDASSQRTIGGGRFLDLRAPARRRRTAARMAELAARAIEEPAGALAALIDREPGYVDLPAFARDYALAEGELARIADALGVIRIAARERAIGLGAATWARLKRCVLARLAAFHEANPDLPGIGLESLRLGSEPRLPTAAFLAVLHGMARAGDLALDGAWVKLAGHEVRLTPPDQRLWDRMAPLLAGAGGADRFRPPRVRDIAAALGAPEAAVRRVAKLLGRMGRLDEVAPDHFFLRATVAEMVRIAADIAAAAPPAENGEFTAAQFRDRLDNGRKVAIQILEFLDRHGVTLRRGDRRRINRHRLDLFAPATDKVPARTGQGTATAETRRAGSL